MKPVVLLINQVCHLVMLKSCFDYNVFFGISGGFSKDLLNVSDPSIINREDIVPDFTFGTYLNMIIFV